MTILLGIATVIAGIAIMMAAVMHGQPKGSLSFTKEELAVTLLPPEALVAVALAPGEGPIKEAANRLLDTLADEAEDQEEPPTPATPRAKMVFVVGVLLSLVGLAILLSVGF